MFRRDWYDKRSKIWTKSHFLPWSQGHKAWHAPQNISIMSASSLYFSFEPSLLLLHIIAPLSLVPYPCPSLPPSLRLSSPLSTLFSFLLSLSCLDTDCLISRDIFSLPLPPSRSHYVITWGNIAEPPEEGESKNPVT